MPRTASTSTEPAKPGVIKQTLEIPAARTEMKESTENARPDFWTYMKQLTPEQWKNHIVYLYRELPRTNIASAGSGGYLAKFSQAFDEEDIKQNYGGYEFSYIMNRGQACVYSGKFRIEAPPRLDAIREAGSNGHGLDAGTVAGIVQQVVGVLREELQRKSNGIDDGGATTKAVDMLKEASDKAMEVLVKRLPQAESAVAQLKELITVGQSLGMLGGGGAEGGGIIGTIKVLKELGVLGNQNDPMKQLETMLSIFDKLDEVRGGGGGRRRDWKAILAERAVDAIPDVLDAFTKTREANLEVARNRRATAEAMGRIPVPGGIPGRQPGAPSVTPTGTAAIPSASGLHTVRFDSTASPAAAAPPATAAAPESAPVVLEMIDRNSPAFDNFLKQTVVEMIYRGEYGEVIVDFLDGAKPGFSETLIQYAPDVVTAFFARDPILAAAVNHPRWPEVLQEARKYLAQADAQAIDQTIDVPAAEVEQIEPPAPRPAPRRSKTKPN